MHGSEEGENPHRRVLLILLSYKRNVVGSNPASPATAHTARRAVCVCILGLCRSCAPQGRAAAGIGQYCMTEKTG